MSTISEGAVIARVNRVLAKMGQVLRKSREPHVNELGQYYGLDVQTNFIIEKDIDLPRLARDLGVLRAGEAIAA